MITSSFLPKTKSECLSRLDGLRTEIHWNEKDMRSISPITSTYASFKRKNEEARKRIVVLQEHMKTLA